MDKVLLSKNAYDNFEKATKPINIFRFTLIIVGVWTILIALLLIQQKNHIGNDAFVFNILSYGFTWVLGVLGILIGSNSVKKRVRERNEAYSKLRQYQNGLEELVKKRTDELERANQALTKLSFLDGLTKISNRRYFDELVKNEWQRSVRNAKPISLIMIDIDFFKKFNDTYGHQIGDDCLKKVAVAIRKEMKRPSDFVARYGGEEFVVVLPDTDERGAMIIAKNIMENVAHLEIEHSASDINDYVTISMGIATLAPKRDSSVTKLIKLADKALYTAKEEGRNRISLAEE